MSEHSADLTTQPGTTQTGSEPATEQPTITFRDDEQATITLSLATLELTDPLALKSLESLGNGESRYRVKRVHAQGGLGKVLVAHDRSLDRDVALKEIREPLADSRSARARFVLEAEITGKLEHPSVVPVYSLGCHADGRPYYAMRFVQGQSFKNAIRAFHERRDRPLDLSRHGLEFRGLLERFLDVCDAIAYAHSRGVIHRDLKPANVMLGAFGETMLVDWGLAKTLTGADIPLEERITATLNSDSGMDTQSGSALGTPAYMSPEQARGDQTQVGIPTDVYGLGATFYMVLTGRSPVPGDDAKVILERVVRGEIPSPRTIEPAVAGALDAICRKAMALDPAQRYASARELALDVRRWMADEPVLAEPEPLRHRASRWVRKHRTAASAVGTCLFTALACSVVALFLLQKSQWEAKRQRQLAADYEATSQTMVALLEELTAGAAPVELEMSRNDMPFITALNDQEFLPSTERSDGRGAISGTDHPAVGIEPTAPPGIEKSAPKASAASLSPNAAARMLAPVATTPPPAAPNPPPDPEATARERFQYVVDNLRANGRSAAADRIQAAIRKYDERVRQQIRGGTAVATGATAPPVAPSMMSD